LGLALCVPDLPQGSLKKIQLDLLAADLAFQVGDTPLRCRQRCIRR
jgi:hypothetical protein